MLQVGLIQFFQPLLVQEEAVAVEQVLQEQDKVVLVLQVKVLMVETLMVILCREMD
jgi:hypothetical protein